MSASAVEQLSTAVLSDGIANKVDLRDRWLDSVATMRAKLAGRTRRAAVPQDLSPKEKRWVAALRDRDPHYQLYRLKGTPTFAAFDSQTLLAAQPWIEIDRVARFSTMSESGILRLCSSWESVPDPVLNPDGTFSFHSVGPSKVAPVGVALRRLRSGQLEVVLALAPQPNYIRVIRVANEYILANGYHRAVSLLRSGQTRLLCVLDDDSDVNRFVQCGGMLQANAILSFRPLLQDYLDPDYASMLELREAQSTVTVSLNVTNTKRLL